MRIIAGSAKGNKLFSFKGDQIRPTLDRVKETLFNILGNDIVDSQVLDLFAGTGNISIEALSRGANKAVLVDVSSDSQKLIIKNIQKCGFADSKNWELLKMDAFKSISTLSAQGKQFNLAYLDPPFNANLYDSCLTQLSKSTILEENATVIAEHFFKETLAEDYGQLTRYREKKIGDSCLSFYTINQTQ
jgi:16S rRNA (guanine(966)-N(2))-methyltransferase RsmD